MQDTIPASPVIVEPVQDASDRETGPLFPVWQIGPVVTAEQIALQQERKVGGRRPHPGGLAQKYFLSDEGRELIRTRYDSQTETINQLAEQLSTPEQQIPRWQMGKGPRSGASQGWTVVRG